MRLTSHRNLSILTTCFVSFSFLEEGGRLFLLHIIGLLPGSSPDYYTFKPLESCLQSMKGAVTVVWVTGQYRWFIIIIISSSTSMNSSSRISIAIQKRTASYARIHIYIYIWLLTWVLCCYFRVQPQQIDIANGCKWITWAMAKDYTYIFAA